MKITAQHRANATEICRLSNNFGHLTYNGRQTVNEVANLSIPMAFFVVDGFVSAVSEVAESYCLSDHAVDEVRALCRRAVESHTAAFGPGWWSDIPLTVAS